MPSPRPRIINYVTALCEPISSTASQLSTCLSASSANAPQRQNRNALETHRLCRRELNWHRRVISCHIMKWRPKSSYDNDNNRRGTGAFCLARVGLRPEMVIFSGSRREIRDVACETSRRENNGLGHRGSEKHHSDARRLPSPSSCARPACSPKAASAHGLRPLRASALWRGLAGGVASCRSALSSSAQPICARQYSWLEKS